MPARKSDKPLRRLIAELATASAEDVQLVLAELEDGERQVATRLLADYVGQEERVPVTEPVEAAAPILVLEGVSDWLAQRLAPSATAVFAVPEHQPLLGKSIADAAPRMTAGALDALKVCAETLVAAGVLKPASSRMPVPGRWRWMRRSGARAASA